MAFIHSFYKKENYLDQNLEVLANLKPNNEVWLLGNRIIKVINPNAPFFKSNTILHIIANKIMSLSIRILLSIGRYLTEQNKEKSEKRVRKFLKKSLFSYEKLQNPQWIGPKERGLLLETLGNRKKNLKKIETLLENDIFGTREIKLQGKDILDQQIESIEKSMFEKDTQEIEEIIKDLQKNEKSAIQFESIHLATTNVRSSLNTIYGEMAVERAIQYYGFNDQFHLSGTEFIALVIGIVTNLTKEDFPDLNEEETLKLLSELRSIRHRAITINKNAAYKNQLVHDQKLLDMFLMVDEYQYDRRQSSKTLKNQPFRQHAYAEYLARHISYALQSHSKAQFSDGILFPMYDENGTKCLKQATNILSHKGLNAALIKPAFPKHDELSTCQLLFRGTSCIDSVSRDIHPFEAVHYYTFDGPGRVSFEKQNKIIFSKTIEALESSGPCELEFIGHSLGGCDSQRAMEYFTKELAEKEKGSYNIRKMSLKVFNSPNIESDIAKRFITNVQKLNKKNVKFDLHFFDVRGDAVQQFGVKRLGFCGHRLEDIPSNLKISVIKFDREMIEKVQNFVYNTFARISTFFGDPVIAHTSYPLKLHENLEEKKTNTMFIHNVISNNEEDLIEHKRGAKYEHKTKEELDEALITTMGRLGRRISKKIHYFTRGYFGRNYAPAK